MRRLRLRRKDDLNPEALTHAIAKSVRDFEHYFNTVHHPKLEEWIEETIKEYLGSRR